MSAWQVSLEKAKEKYGLTGKATKKPYNELWLKTAEIHCKAHPDSAVCEELAQVAPKHKHKHKSHKHCAGKKVSRGEEEEEGVITLTKSPGVYDMTTGTKLRPASAPSQFFYATPTQEKWKSTALVNGSLWKDQHAQPTTPGSITDILQNILGGPLVRDGMNPAAYEWEFPKFMGKDNATALKTLNLKSGMRKKLAGLFAAALKEEKFKNTKDCIDKFAKVKVAAALDADSVSAVACLVNEKSCKKFPVTGKEIPLPVSVKHALSYIEHKNITHANEKGTWVGHDNVYREVLAGLLLSELVTNKLSPHFQVVYSVSKIVNASTDLEKVFESSTKDEDEDVAEEGADNENGVEDDTKEVDDDDEDNKPRTLPGVCIVSEACQSSLAESLTDMCPKLIRVVLLQVCQALISARQHFGLFHNNLCPENVLLAAVPSNTSFYYKVNGGVRAVASYGISCRLSGLRHCTSTVFDPLDTKVLLASKYTLRTPRSGSIEMHDMASLVASMLKVVGRSDVGRYLTLVETWMRQDAEMYESASRTSPNSSDTSALHRLFHFVAGRDSPVITSVPKDAETYDTEGAIDSRHGSLASTYGEYLTFDRDSHQFYINKTHPSAGPINQRKIKADKKYRVHRQCAANPGCAKKQKDMEARRISNLEKTLGIRGDLEDIQHRLITGYAHDSSERRAVKKTKAFLCTGNTCKLLK